MRAKLQELRKLLKENGIDVFITSDTDDHISEYPDRHFACMRYISGFTGTDGTLAVSACEAGLWTDGRYFIQAAAELKDTGITLMKMGEPDCPDMAAWISDHIPDGGTAAFDGRCFPASFAAKLQRMASERNIKLISDKDYVGEIWTEGRPKRRAMPVWILQEKYAGKSAEEKINDIFEALSEKGIGAHIITAMDDIAWILNLRGDDIPYSPVFDAFMMFADASGRKSVRLYISETHLTDEVSEYLQSCGVEVFTDTEKIYEDAGKLECGTVLIDKSSSSYQMAASVSEKTLIIDDISPAGIMKGRKNSTEAANLRKAQLKDSVAVTKYMYWFKNNVSMGKLTEYCASDKLYSFRSEQDGFLGNSFETISAYGENAAMCHYSPSREKDVPILTHGLYLVDSGGHYYEGSTDITRTWTCGPVTDEEKKGYTLTAAANLRLSGLIFKEGTSGQTIDLAARSVFWKEGFDYNHGTGHGVGYLLNVHEGPAGIRPGINSSAKYGGMYEGVYISDEPGLYIEGKFGVRLENMLLCVKDFSNEYGTFMHFDVLTMVPFDREAVDITFMDSHDIELYNDYHKKVYETVSPFLTKEEAEWLKEMCRPLS